MDWIKKNLVLVISAAVTLIGLGVAGYYLYTKIQLSNQVGAQLEEQDQKLQQLMRMRPHPGNRKVDNIALAKEQEAKLDDFAKRARELFVPVPYPTNLDSGSFGLLLADTLDNLHRRARLAGTKLPDGYAFTFETQKKALSFDPKSVIPLTRALMEVKAISETLLDARVIELDRIRRISVAANDTPGLTLMGGTSDYWTRKPVTNDLAIIIPYEVVFRAFSSELQAFMEGLARSPHSLLLKNLVVDTGETNEVDMFAPDLGTGGDESGMPRMSPQMMMMMRYGLRPGMRMPMMPQPTDPATEAARVEANKIVSEKPFRVTAWVDVVRLRDPAEAAATRGRPRRGPAEAGTDAATQDANPDVSAAAGN